NPSNAALKVWLQLTDELLASAWGSMVRYHLAWLQVGRPSEAIRGRPMTPDEESRYVRDVAAAKTAVLRMSVEALTRHVLTVDGGSKQSPTFRSPALPETYALKTNTPRAMAPMMPTLISSPRMNPPLASVRASGPGLPDPPGRNRTRETPELHRDSGCPD